MAIDREALQSQSYVLRQELKQWEKQFASRPSSKPSRSDIKSDPAIEAKYKEYSRIRDVLSMKVGPPPMPESPQRSSEKRKHRMSANEATPLKRRRRDTSTPTKSKDSDALNDHVSPSSNASTPHRRAFVGPTPQKDGHVLGLFDTLDPDMEIDSATPIKAREVDVRIVGRPALVETHANASNSISTPRKAQKVFGMNEPGGPAALTTPTTESKHQRRTPQSSARRFLLDKFATPSKRKRSSGEQDQQSNPSQQSGLPGDSTATPAFLRRDSSRFSSLPAVEEEENPAGPDDPDNAASPSLVRRHTRKPSFRPSSRPGGFRSFTRSLSSLMADIHQAYESRYEDDEAALREAEAEMDSALPPKPSSAPAPRTEASHRPTNSIASSTTLVADSQAPDAPGDIDAKLLGPDGAHAPSESDSDAKGPHRTYKKRGAKRQTRRVILKPAKRLPKPPHAQAHTQPTGPAQPTVADERGSQSVFPYASSASSEAEAEGQEGDSQEPARPRAAKKMRMSPPDGEEDDGADDTDDASPKRDLKSAWSATTATTSAATEGSGKEPARSSMDVVRKATKRMSATAHANFRKLKLRSKGSGGGGGGGAAGGKRWGRRR